VSLDPRWEWIEEWSLGNPQPEFVKGRCNHLEVVPVETAGGDVVAYLCLTCDEQLPEEWKP
jgi:hypothetical protein